MAIDEDPEGHELAAIRQLVPSFASLHVLEVGCGDGRLTELYLDEAASVIGVDPDAEAIADLAEALPGVDGRVISFEDLVLPAESVDLLLLAWSL